MRRPSLTMKGRISVPAKNQCEDCEHYDYDEYTDEYVCTMNLDEDEYVRYLTKDRRGCPYYRQYDEYKTVRKQN